MAPSVTNSDATNSTTIVQFNSVTQLPIKLAGSHNFSLWKAQVSMLMRGHNLYGHLDDYLNQVRSLCDELATAGAPVTNAELIVKTLTGLGPEYREISAAIRARDTPISYAELFEKLSDHELFLKHNAPPQSTLITAVVAQKSSSQTRTNTINNNRHSNNYQQHSQSGRNRRTNSQEVSLVCQLCDRPGHSARVCRSQSHNHFQARANFAG
ncbi:uncharacterized protein [Solanum tuberosum]|uniref:uncharacterized protein n=1 Tax=Solanum tuberosum TaxID=4113 RepID=UPI00073A02DD|nr:PREDICTED: uncharacterized protein LOC107058299 [Solanum tuberosum]